MMRVGNLFPVVLFSVDVLVMVLGLWLVMLRSLFLSYRTIIQSIHVVFAWTKDFLVVSSVVSSARSSKKTCLAGF
jgi:hypothetical protein